jgi:hypothetical protein
VIKVVATTQLPPVRAQPTYAYRGLTVHLAARFYLFDKVVELDRPFCQTGSDPTQIRFRDLLARVANCEVTEKDWEWLQTRNPCLLNAEENDLLVLKLFKLLSQNYCQSSG